MFFSVGDGYLFSSIVPLATIGLETKLISSLVHR